MTNYKIRAAGTTKAVVKIVNWSRVAIRVLVKILYRTAIRAAVKMVVRAAIWVILMRVTRSKGSWGIGRQEKDIVERAEKGAGKTNTIYAFGFDL